MTMLPFNVDYNERERYPDGTQGVEIRLRFGNPETLLGRMQVGLRVLVYDDEIRSEAVLQRAIHFEGWVAILIPESIRDLSAGEFVQLQAETRRAGLRLIP